MNILVVSRYGLYQSCESSFVHAQAQAYAALGHRVRVLILIPLGKKNWDGKRLSAPLQRVERDGLELYLLRFLSLSNYGEKRFNDTCAIWAVRVYADRLLEGFTPDVIHAHALGLSSEVGAWLKSRLGVPLVVTSHGETVCHEKWQDRALLKRAAEKADAVVSVSSMLQRVLEESGASVPMRVVLNGFRSHCASALRQKTPLSVLQVSGLISLKHVDDTIQAFAILQKQHPDAALTVIGDGPERQRLEDLCRSLSLQSAVRFTGYLPNSQVFQQMQDALFFVMPSFPEGFGIVYLEAMTCGCVTIGTENEGISDLIVHGKNGFLIPRNDPKAIVQVIEWCLEHPDEAAAIAERGRRDAQGLTWEKNAKQYTALFQELLSGAPLT